MRAQRVQVGQLPAALDALGAPSPRPVLVCVGGADGMSEDDAARVRMVVDHVVPVVERLDAVVVDGGTDAGLMRALGRARAARGDSFWLLGVAAEGTVEEADLEPHHSGVLLVPGDRWGDETPWLADAAACLSGPRRSATLLLNGGDVARADVERSLADGRPVLVVAGSGRLADVLASSGRGTPGLVVVPLDRPDDVARALAELLEEPREV
jgi:hypothetical protein